MEEIEKAEQELLQKKKEVEDKLEQFEDLKEKTDEELRKIEALREENRRIAEKLKASKQAYFQERLNEAYKKLDISEELQQNLNQYFADKEIPEEQIEEEIKKVVPQFDWQGYWEMRKKEEEITKKVIEEAGAGGISGKPITQQQYPEEVLKYAQEHNLEPEKAAKILEKFSQRERKIE